MATSIAYHATKKGGPMEVATVTKPVVESPTDVQIQMKAVSFQPLDPLMVDYGVYVSKWPVVTGMNGAGVVTAIGDQVSRFAVGDEVFGLFNPGDDRKAAFQEFAVVHELNLTKKPTSLSLEDAASLPIPWVTALAATYSCLNVEAPHLPVPEKSYKPQSILVLGGSSSVGAAALQILRSTLPNTAVLTTSSQKHHDRMKQLGATTAFDRDASLDSIRAATPGGDGVDAILGIVPGAVDRPEILQLLKESGDKIFVEVRSGRNTENVPEGVQFTQANGFMVWEKPGVMDALTSMMKDGTFELPVDVDVVGHGWDALGKAYDRMRSGVSGKKLVVTL